VTDLNLVAEALASILDVDTWEIGGQTWTVTTYAEVPGTVNTPALAIELDDVAYDVSMGRGADTFTFLAHVIVSEASQTDGQKLVRQLLSTGPGTVSTSLKEALEANQDLGGQVSYAVIRGTRTIGSINYAGTEYLGATLEIEVMS
jgi:hypothetical protein